MTIFHQDFLKLLSLPNLLYFLFRRRLGRGGRVILDRLPVPEARNVRDQLTDDPFQFTDDPAWLPGDPARLTGNPGRLTSDPARLSGDPARRTGDPGRLRGGHLGGCIIRPVTPPHLQLEDWDPYMVGR